MDIIRSLAAHGRALLALCGAALTLPTVAPAHAQAQGFVLPSAGCPMAHCDSRMSDQLGTLVPATAASIRIDTIAVGGGGLGCVSNLRHVACTYRGDPLAQSNLVVYDADGNRVWEDGGQLGPTAWMSAPIIGDDGTVIATDQQWVMRVDPLADTVLWKSAKPDTGDPISPVLVGSDRSMVFVATNTSSAGGVAEISVWDVTTGALLARQPLVDAATGKVYHTRNTVAVRDNRAYVLAEGVADRTDGRLFAIDVCNASGCGGRGSMAVRWQYGFKGPSGASPLLIGTVLYFDGRPTLSTGTLMAVSDRGSSPRRLWVRAFGSSFGVSAAQDPRGGVWVHPSSASDKLLRLSTDSGATVQTIDVSAALGLAPGYIAQSVVSVGQTPAGAVALIIGVSVPGRTPAPTYLAAVDVSSSAAGAALWRYQVAANPDVNSAAAQFPIVINASGARRVVFNGSKSSTFFVGEP